MIYHAIPRKARTRPLYATIGIFDGVHLGHQKVLAALVAAARKDKKEAAVITFAPHPYRVLHPEKAPRMLVSLEHRIRLLQRAGIGTVYVIPFTRAFARTTPRDFAEKILLGKLRVSQLVLGDTFALGHKRAGTIAQLRQVSRHSGIRLCVIRNKSVRGMNVSSTAIRRFVTRGDLRGAARMLGRPFSVFGTVIHGDKRGRRIGFPTANLNLRHGAVPPAGVYAVSVDYGPTRYDGIANIGFRPTFTRGRGEQTVEVFIFGFKRRIYGAALEIFFVKRIRGERRFKHYGHLTKRIVKDIAEARIALA